MKPQFIVFEGIDGSGKSSQIELLKEKLIEHNIDTVITSEPTNNAIGKLIKSAMKGSSKIDQKSIAALFLADRLNHITDPENGLLKILQEGKTIICSRYYFSSIAFQSEFISERWMKESVNICSNLLKANISFYLSIQPEKAINRIKNRANDFEIYENINKLSEAHQTYLKSFKDFSNENIHIIDAERSIIEIHNDIWAEIKKIFLI